MLSSAESTPLTENTMLVTRGATSAQDHYQNSCYMLEQTTDTHQPISFDQTNHHSMTYPYNINSNTMNGSAAQKSAVMTELGVVGGSGNGNELCDLSLSHELQQMDEDEEYVEHDLDGDTDDSEEDDDDESSGDTSSSDENEDDDMSDCGRQRKKSKATRRGTNLNSLNDKPNEKSGGIGSGSHYLDLTKRIDEHNMHMYGSFDNNDDEEMRLAALKQLHEKNFITLTQKDETTQQMQEGKFIFLRFRKTTDFCRAKWTQLIHQVFISSQDFNQKCIFEARQSVKEI
jgi:hypothetical protein